MRSSPTGSSTDRTQLAADAAASQSQAESTETTGLVGRGSIISSSDDTAEQMVAKRRKDLNLVEPFRRLLSLTTGGGGLAVLLTSALAHPDRFELLLAVYRTATHCLETYRRHGKGHHGNEHQNGGAHALTPPDQAVAAQLMSSAEAAVVTYHRYALWPLIYR